MKKIILLSIMFISLIGNINAQDSTKVELTKETIYKDVKNALSQLGDALKVGAEHVYEILVKQQIVDSITRIVVYIVVLLPVLFLLQNGYRLEKLQNKNYSSTRNDLIGWSYVPGVIIGILLLGYFFVTIGSTVTGFVNPEYGAIKEIMELIK